MLLNGQTTHATIKEFDMMFPHLHAPQCGTFSTIQKEITALKHRNKNKVN